MARAVLQGEFLSLVGSPVLFGLLPPASLLLPPSSLLLG